MATTCRTMGLAACLGLLAVYSWLAARSFQATRLASSLDVNALGRAVELEPRNAAYQDLLCRFLLFDKQEAGAALPRCQRATDLNPYQLYILARSRTGLLQYGRGIPATTSNPKAISVDPTTPDVAWNAANFFLAQGKVAEALHQFAVVMRSDPSMVRPSLDLCWRTLHDVNAIEAILPPDPDAYLQFIRLLIANNQWEGAHQVWSALLRLNEEIDYRQGLVYVDSLLQQRDIAGAEKAWDQLAAHSATLSHYGRMDKLVVDGGFEQAILNAGFDWRYSAQPGSTVSVDNTEFHSGRQSLLISYNGAGGNAGISQYVVVKPNTEYTISAWTRSQELDSANGPAISARDAYDGKSYAMTQETLGTAAWHRVESSFQTGPETTLVMLCVARDPADTHIKGSFWVDDVSLQPDSLVPPHTD